MTSDSFQILDCFDYLLDRTERASGRIAMFKSHEAATAALVATAKIELSTPIISRPQRQRPQSMIMDTVMTPAPSRTTGPRNPRRRSSGSALHDAPLSHLLATLALSLPTASTSNPSQTTTATTTTYLSNALVDRAAKSAEITRATQTAFERTATAHLADARTALQLIRDSVLAESPFAEIHLVDPGIEASIGVLAQETHNVVARLDGVEREAAGLARGRNVRRDELVARWGGLV